MFRIKVVCSQVLPCLHVSAILLNHHFTNPLSTVSSGRGDLLRSSLCHCPVSIKSFSKGCSSAQPSESWWALGIYWGNRKELYTGMSWPCGRTVETQIALVQASNILAIDSCIGNYYSHLWGYYSLSKIKLFVWSQVFFLRLCFAFPKNFTHIVDTVFFIHVSVLLYLVQMLLNSKKL